MLRLTLSPKNRKFILHVFLENKSLFIIAIKHQSVNEPSCSTKRFKNKFSGKSCKNLVPASH